MANIIVSHTTPKFPEFQTCAFISFSCPMSSQSEYNLRPRRNTISWRLAQRGHYTQRQNSPREHEGEESTELTTMIVQTTVDVTAGEDHLYLLYTGTK